MAGIDPDDVVKGYRALYDRHATDAAHSFRFRLRECAKAALTLGDEMLQVSQDAGEPSENQLRNLRNLEDGLSTISDLYVPKVKPKAAA